MPHAGPISLSFLAPLALALAHAADPPAQHPDPPPLFETELARAASLARAGEPELATEAALVLRHIGHRRAEPVLLPLARHPDPLVRLETTKALATCGGRDSIPALVGLLADPSWETAANAREALVRMTSQPGERWAQPEWRAWLERDDWKAKEGALLSQLAAPDRSRAIDALVALRAVGSPAAESAILARAEQLGPDGIRAAVRALERVGTPRAAAWITRVARGFPETAWTLAEIDRAAAEPLLLEMLSRWGAAPWGWSHIDPLVNLDRIRSTRCEPHLPALLRAFGLVTFRAIPDDLHLAPNARQRLAANLILRTGQAPRIADLILKELEGTRADAETPPHLRQILADMRKELKPGFVREDGLTLAQPLAALPRIIRDRALVPRLVPLLEHPAFIARIYAAESLAALHAEESAPAILAQIHAPYPFHDATTLASGKHFDRSQSVRWRGYLCISLGRLGGTGARTALESIATDPDTTRDLRYGATVGLGFLRSPDSIPALQRVAREDLILEIRRAATAAVHEIDLQQLVARRAQR